VNEFYLTVAGFCFTLIGLWWAVIQTRFSEWLVDPRMARLSRAVFLAFLYPGLMSLAAALSGEVKILWQLVFVLAGVLGTISSLSFVSVARGPALRGYLMASTVLYLGVIGGSFIAMFSPALVLPLTPLQVEGLLVTLLIAAGVSLASELQWKK
jgi:hypothetical protein